MGPRGSHRVAFVATALAVCVGACSSPAPAGNDSSYVALPTRATPAAGDTAPPTKEDSAPLDAGTSDPTPSPSTTCPAAPPTVYPPWHSPTTHGRPCTADDLTAYLANESHPFDAQKSAMAARNPSCASCVFTKESDTSWGPVTKTSDGRNFVDFGLCYAYAGASDGCGSSAHTLEWCIQKVCNVCLDGQNPTDCKNGAIAGACKSSYDATISSCSAFGDIVNTTCGGSGNVVGVLCGGN